MTMPAPTTSQGTDPRTWAIIVWVLYIASAITGITIIVGLVIAYVKRRELEGTPFASHMTYAIRTFWISFFLGLVFAILIFVLIGIPLLIALCIWSLFRVIKGLIRALDGRPIENPTGWL